MPRKSNSRTPRSGGVTSFLLGKRHEKCDFLHEGRTDSKDPDVTSLLHREKLLDTVPVRSLLLPASRLMCILILPLAEAVGLSSGGLVSSRAAAEH